MNPKNATNLEPKSGVITFILIQIRDDDLNEPVALLGPIIEVLMQHEFTIVTVISSLIVATVGFPMKNVGDPIKNCEQVTSVLSSNYRGELKMLSGSLSGKYGISGHPKRNVFGPLLPGFGALLNQVTALEYGECKKITQ